MALLVEQHLAGPKVFADLLVPQQHDVTGLSGMHRYRNDQIVWVASIIRYADALRVIGNRLKHLMGIVCVRHLPNLSEHSLRCGCYW